LRIKSDISLPASVGKGKAMIWRRLFERKPSSSQALYEQIVAAARRQRFYAEWGVPDTLDGRFDMITLHMFLVLERLKEAPDETRQALVDAFFLDMDRSLREMGVGDLSVGKKVRKMSESFYGRLKAYRDAGEDGGALEAALARNIYAGEGSEGAATLAAWALAARRALGDQDVAAMASGRVDFVS
jgi:cytochrome b pre-mRNA-processing protein 3